MNDFQESLKEHLKEEFEDAASYEELAKMANDPGEAQILRDIAEEERVHAAHLEYILGKANADL